MWNHLIRVSWTKWSKAMIQVHYTILDQGYWKAGIRRFSDFHAVCAWLAEEDGRAMIYRMYTI